MANLPRLLPLIAIAIGGVVAVRAVGAGPDLLQGARAWAQEATPETAAATTEPRKPIPAPCVLSPEQLAEAAGVSPAELRVLQSLTSRRKELDARDTDLATTLPLLMAAEQKVDAKIQALNAIKAEVNVLLGQVDEKEKAETDRLVAVYSAMRPREAAAVFATLDDSVRLPIASAMRPRALSAILAQMPAPAAKELTEKLARRFQAQQLAARAAAASAIGAAPVPAAATQPVPTPAAAVPAATPAPRPAANRPAASRPAPTRQSARPAANRPAPAASTASPTPERPPAETPASQPQPYRPAAADTGPAATASPRQSVE